MFGQRLKEERNRLKLNQEEFGEACGVRKQAQIKYEKGERKPDSDYLQKAYELGVDVSYLFTGVRAETLQDSSNIRSYRINGEEQDIVLARINLMINNPDIREGLMSMSEEQTDIMMRLIKSFAGD
ncbi:helix-turn-helix domain-containing protein [Psychrobacter lutiphocae]|uniref:helix-turn-helix domain-containing protein n=1 Tax=Psychrobacter lutiphocae TaxID=540500 RepID=UPI0003753507|nr:helix-turn-helix transcriptional regulator [Psychrobacter lutiphocae]